MLSPTYELALAIEYNLGLMAGIYSTKYSRAGRADGKV
jgi:hypothetical protein